MSSPLPAKRRRLNDAASTLSKPFKTPLKSASSSTAPDSTTVIGKQVTPTASAKPGRPPPNISAARTPGGPTRTPLRTPLRAPSHPSASPTDSATLAAQNAVNALEAQIRSARADIDALRQATTILSRGQSTRLAQLAAKWQTASQEVADALFGGAKDKVDAMGGVKAWKAEERRRRTQGAGFWDEEDEMARQDAAVREARMVDDEGFALGDEDASERRVELRRAMGWARDVATEKAREAERKALEEREEEEADEGKVFTMEMMLKSLNIELDLIGYDKRLQQWTA